MLKKTLPTKRIVTQFLVLNLLYMCAVFGWTLFVRPLGRDFAAFAQPESLPWLTSWLWRGEIALFGKQIAGYHLVNLALLYSTMVTIFFLTRLLTKRPWWLGSLAAVLFMANPIKTEAVLNLSGVQDILPCLLALWALLGYILYSRTLHPGRYVVALLLFAVAVLTYPTNGGLVFVLLLYLVILRRLSWKTMTCFAPFLLLAVAGWFLHRDAYTWAGMHPKATFAPLFLVLYPIGLLPETAAHLYQFPPLRWGAALLTVSAVFFLCKKIRSNTIFFIVFAVLAIRLFQGETSIDWVHRVGGGGLLTSTALLCIAFASLCGGIIQHPKWHRPTLLLTTLLCLLCFILQTRDNLAWRQAGIWAHDFQKTVAATVEKYPKKTLGQAPDFRYYRGAPLCLSESVEYDTPFSKATPVCFWGKLHYEKEAKIRANPREDLKDIFFQCAGILPEYLIGAPYYLRQIRYSPDWESFEILMQGNEECTPTHWLNWRHTAAVDQETSEDNSIHEK